MTYLIDPAASPLMTHKSDKKLAKGIVARLAAGEGGAAGRRRSRVTDERLRWLLALPSQGDHSQT
jgi:hypothetical protein